MGMCLYILKANTKVAKQKKLFIKYFPFFHYTYTSGIFIVIANAYKYVCMCVCVCVYGEHKQLLKYATATHTHM